MVYKSRATISVKEKTSSGTYIKATTTCSSTSTISEEDAYNKACNKAKKISIEKLTKEIKLINSVLSEVDICSNLKLKPHYQFNTDVFNPAAGTFKPAAAFTGYTAPQIKNIYNIPPISNAQNTRKVVITIVIAYRYPNLQNDFNKFCSLNSLPPYTLKIVSLGKSTDSGWAQEECLDTQWAYAINPNACIQVVEAASSGFNDLFAAVSYANNPPSNSTLAKTDIISMSWGTNDFGPSQPSYDNVYFTNPSICYVASSGDTNSPSWPATSSNVLAAGGSTLVSNPTYTSRVSESTWFNAGCGLSTVYTKPDFQQKLATLSSFKKRSMPDVSAVANPSTGVQVVYNGSIYTFGGTSVSAPITAGMLSIAIQNRLNLKNTTAITTAYSYYKSNPSTTTLLQNLLYDSTKYANLFYDIKIGKDGIYSALPNYDIATGLGVLSCKALQNELASY